MGTESIKISLNEKIVVLQFEPFDSDIDVDEITRIQYDNLYGEAITVSTLLNRVGLLKAEMDNHYSEEEFALEIYKSDLRKLFKSNATSDQKKLTVQEMEDLVLQDTGYQAKYKKLLKTKKNQDYINSLYWSIQSKDRKLSVLMKGVTPEEFEKNILEKSVNTIMVKKVDKLIK